MFTPFNFYNNHNAFKEFSTTPSVRNHNNATVKATGMLRNGVSGGYFPYIPQKARENLAIRNFTYLCWSHPIKTFLQVLVLRWCFLSQRWLVGYLTVCKVLYATTVMWRERRLSKRRRRVCETVWPWQRRDAGQLAPLYFYSHSTLLRTSYTPRSYSRRAGDCSSSFYLGPHFAYQRGTPLIQPGSQSTNHNFFWNFKIKGDRDS